VGASAEYGVQEQAFAEDSFQHGEEACYGEVAFFNQGFPSEGMSQAADGESAIGELEKAEKL
jgi:hypothetical protein